MGMNKLPILEKPEALEVKLAKADYSQKLRLPGFGILFQCHLY
jgi:hypothetical protein